MSDTVLVNVLIGVSTALTLMISAIIVAWVNGRGKSKDVQTENATELKSQQATIDADAAAKKLTTAAERETEMYDRQDAELKYLREQSDKHQKGIDDLNDKIHALQIDNLKSEGARAAADTKIVALEAEVKDLKRQLVEAAATITKLSGLLSDKESKESGEAPVTKEKPVATAKEAKK